MKAIISITLIGILFLTACQNKQQLLIKNNQTVEITDKQCIYTRVELENSFGTLPDKGIPTLIIDDNTMLPCQLDDMNQDGKWDELAFVINLKASEEKKARFEILPLGTKVKYKQRTNIRFAKKDNLKQEITFAERINTYNNVITQAAYQMEGPAWENDKVGFRQYIDNRNGFDIFGKKSPDMALDGAGINGQDYHTLDKWGMDILKVANSLGAGGFALLVDDSLYRLGPGSKSYVKVITEGPVRSTILFDYKNWKIEGNNYNVQHFVTIWAGKYYYESKIIIDGIIGNEKLVQGIVNKETDTLYVKEQENKIILATYGKQSLNNDFLGMAISFDKNIFIESGKTTDKGNGITETYYALLKVENNKSVITKFYACWEKTENRFSELKGVLEYVKNN